MNKNTFQFRSSILPLCLIAACAVGTSVQAATITNLTATASYNMPGTGPVTLPPQSSPTFVDILSFTSDISSNNIGIHTYADSSTASFGSRASGGGTYDTIGNIQVTGTFTGGTFSSDIIPGQLYVSTPSGYVFGGGEFVSAHLLFTLVIDGATTFTSNALLSWNSGGLTSSTAETPGGFNIGYALTTGVNFATYTFGASTQTIGGLGAGPHTFDYTIFAEAHGVTHAVQCAGGRTDPATGGSTGQGGQGVCLANSGAQSGDPLQSLPEPGSLALFGVGILGLAWSRLQKHMTPKSYFRVA